QIDRFLVRWNCSDLLLDQRRELRGKLDPDEELSNWTAIGYACVARGLFVEARQAYDEAARYLDASDDLSAVQKLTINRAQLRWADGATIEAEQLYAEL